MNLRTGLETDNYSITFWAKNVFDKKYNCVAFAFSGAAARALVGPPRACGVTCRAYFYAVPPVPGLPGSGSAARGRSADRPRFLSTDAIRREAPPTIRR